MTDSDTGGRVFNVFCIGQAGRLGYEAVVFAATFRAANPNFPGRLIVAEPQPGPRWQGDPRLPAEIRTLLEGFEAEIVPFDNQHFGQSYPYGNKIEGLLALPRRRTLHLLRHRHALYRRAFLGWVRIRPPRSIDAARGDLAPDRALRAGLRRDVEIALRQVRARFRKLARPDQARRILGTLSLFQRGLVLCPLPPRLRPSASSTMRWRSATIRPKSWSARRSTPWLDQVALPLAVHAFGGGRPGPELAGRDGDVTCHYRTLPLLYARESDAAVAMLEGAIAPNPIKKVLKAYEPLKKLVYQGKGKKVRAMFDQNDLPRREQAIRNRIKQAKLWLR